MMRFKPISRANLAQYCVRLINHGRWAAADVWLVQVDNKLAVVKDYKGRSWLFRALGKWLLRRELRTYRRLNGLAGIPEFYGRLDEHAIILRYVEGQKIAGFKPGELPAQFFKGLDALVNGVHARGIASRDLTSRNIIITQDYKPYLIDFAVAFVKGTKFNFLRNMLFNQFCDDDLYAVAKIKRRLAPQLLTPEQRRILVKRGIEEKIRLGIKRIVNKLRRK